VAEALDQRRRERDRLLALAEAYIETLTRRLPVSAAVVVGSVARGDFNVWSDVDVVIVSPALPDRIPERAALLAASAPARVQPVGFRPEEFATAWRKANPLAREATTTGVTLRGKEYLAQLIKT
jgi:predicted nucleotidyltransferase